MNGDAVPNNSGVDLTGGFSHSVGSAFYGVPLALASFTATFNVRVTPESNTPADGMMFVLQTSGLNALGNDGDGLGGAGLTGYGAELDIYQNSGCADQDSNHAGVDSLATCGSEPTSLAEGPDLSTTSAGTLIDANWRTVQVMVSGGTMSVAISAPSAKPPAGNPVPVPSLQAVPLPGYSASTAYYLGFTGACGGGSAYFSVYAVTISAPTPFCY